MSIPGRQNTHTPRVSNMTTRISRATVTTMADVNSYTVTDATPVPKKTINRKYNTTVSYFSYGIR